MSTYHYIDIEKCEKATEAEAEAMGGGTFYRCPVNGKVVGISKIVIGADDSVIMEITVGIHFPGGGGSAALANLSASLDGEMGTPFVNKSQFFSIDYQTYPGEPPLTEEQKPRFYLVIEGTEGRCPC